MGLPALKLLQAQFDFEKEEITFLNKNKYQLQYLGKQKFENSNKIKISKLNKINTNLKIQNQNYKTLNSKNSQIQNNNRLLKLWRNKKEQIEINKQIFNLIDKLKTQKFKQENKLQENLQVNVQNELNILDMSCSNLDKQNLEDLKSKNLYNHPKLEKQETHRIKTTLDMKEQTVDENTDLKTQNPDLKQKVLNGSKEFEIKNYQEIYNQINKKFKSCTKYIVEIKNKKKYLDKIYNDLKSKEINLGQNFNFDKIKIQNLKINQKFAINKNGNDKLQKTKFKIKPTQFKTYYCKLNTLENPVILKNSKSSTNTCKKKINDPKKCKNKRLSRKYNQSKQDNNVYKNRLIKFDKKQKSNLRIPNKFIKRKR